MILVIDANILFAAMLKEGMTSDLIFKHTLYAPEFIFEEFSKYKDYLKGKMSRSEKEFGELFEVLQRYIILIPIEETQPFISQAEKISPDLKDVPYIALALKLNCSIWSNDKELKKQNKINIYSTNDLC